MNISASIDLPPGARPTLRRTHRQPLPVDAGACRQLWVRVIETAILDATGHGTGLAASGRGATQRHADLWMRSSPEMLTVAALAGLDGPAIRQRYEAGLIDVSMILGKRLRAS